MASAPDEILLSEIIASVWGRRWQVVVITAMFGLAALALAFVLPEKYTASVTLAPVEDDSSNLGGASALLSQFGGLASLGGLNLGSGGKSSESIATLKSAALTESFIREKNLLPILFSDDWNSESRTWKPGLLGDWIVKEPPTVWRAEELFREDVRTVREDKKTGLVTMVITWEDPVIAANWANELVERTNTFLRAEAIERSNKNLAYLNEQLAKTSVVELQKSIYSLIENEIKKVMIASGSDEFAFKVIDAARPPEERSTPKRGLLTILGLMIGLALGVLYALAFPRSRPERP